VARVLVTDLDGEVTVYDPDDDLVYPLNSTASDIWRLMDGDHCLDEIVELIAAAYVVDSDEIRPHVRRTVATFVDRDLVSVAGDG
jgi:hypothetical protein